MEMSDNRDLIRLKRAAVEKEISSLRTKIAEKEQEIERLDIAGKVLAEMTGVEYSP